MLASTSLAGAELPSGSTSLAAASGPGFEARSPAGVRGMITAVGTNSAALK